MRFLKIYRVFCRKGVNIYIYIIGCAYSESCRTSFIFGGIRNARYTGHRQENHYRSLELSGEAERGKQADCRVQRRQKRSQDVHRIHRRDLAGVHQELRPVRRDRQEAHLQEVILWAHRELPRKKSWKCSNSTGY